MASSVKVTLGADPVTGEGGVEVDVYPQRHAYLTRRLGKWISDMAQGLEDGGQIAVDNVGMLAGEQGYKLTVALIPTLAKRMSLWEWQGYASREAMEAGDMLPESESVVPTVPEIWDALEIAARVTKVDVLKVLKGMVGTFVDPTVLRPLITEQVAQVIDSISMISPSSPSESDGSEASTSSGTSPRTSTESTESPSLASVA